MIKFDFSTTDYQFTHGKRPSGRGYWAFQVYTAGRWSEPIFCPGERTLSEAKSWFRSGYEAQCRACGESPAHVSVRVCS